MKRGFWPLEAVIDHSIFRTVLTYSRHLSDTNHVKLLFSASSVSLVRVAMNLHHCFAISFVDSPLTFKDLKARSLLPGSRWQPSLSKHVQPRTAQVSGGSGSEGAARHPRSATSSTPLCHTHTACTLGLPLLLTRCTMGTQRLYLAAVPVPSWLYNSVSSVLVGH